MREYLVNKATHINPFPGLRPFREEEEYLFFGRESQTDAMVSKLAETRFLVVVGTSGSGKSSLVNCGLRPALHRGLMAPAGTTWRTAKFRPGRHPLKAMVQALAQEGVLFSDYDEEGLALSDIIETTLRISKLGLIDIYGQAQLGRGVNLLVIVDQFEELFRYQQKADANQEKNHGVNEEAIAFVNLLIEVREQINCPIYVVLTMRSDFLGDCAQFPGLPEAVNAGQYLVPRMTRIERRAAISGPVRVGGTEVSPVLLTRLVNDVGSNPDQLSILQHALNRTWTHWQKESDGKGSLNLMHYKGIGTMAHALDQHAEQAYTELETERQRWICEKLFKSLTDKGTDIRGIRRPTTIEELCALTKAPETEVIEVIDVFRHPSRSFLMPPAGEKIKAETVIDISHESLMRVWERLKIWASEEASSADNYRHIERTAILWNQGQAALWSYPDLENALAWKERQKPDDVWAQRYGRKYELAMAFLNESKEKRDQKTRSENRRRISIVLGIIFLILSGAGFFIYQARQKAVVAKQQVVLVKEQAKEQVNEVKKQKEKVRQELSYDKVVNYARDQAIMEQMAQDKQDERKTQVKPKSNTVLIRKDRLEPEKIVRLALGVALKEKADEIKKGTKLWPVMLGMREAIQNPGWKSNRYLNISTPDSYFFGPRRHFNGPANFSSISTGNLLAGLNRKAQITIWDIGASGKESILWQAAGLLSVAVSSNDKNLVTSSWGGIITIWDMEARQLVSAFNGHQQTVWAVAFSPGGKHLATAGKDGTVKIWDVSNRQKLRTIKAHTRDVRRVVYNKAGNRIATAGWDNKVKIWDPASGEKRMEMTGHTRPVNSVSFNSDGSRLVTAASDGTVRIWATDSGDELLLYKGHDRAVRDAAYSPNDLLIASAGSAGDVLIWDSVTGQIIKKLSFNGKVWSVAFSRDSRYIAIAGENMPIKVWDIDSNKWRRSLVGHEGRVNEVLFSSDGLISVGDDQTCRMWNMASGREEQRYSNQIKGPFFEMELSRSGNGFATLGKGEVKVYDAKTGSLINALNWQPHDVLAAAARPKKKRLISSGLLSVALGPNRKNLVTSSWLGTIALWDAETMRLKGTFSSHQKVVWDVAFSPDGQHLASAGQDGTLKIWDVSNRQELRSIKAHTKDVRQVVYNKTGNRIATAGWDNKVIIWDAKTGEKCLELAGHTRPVNSVSFNSDGSRLVTGASDGTVRVWEADTGEQLLYYRGHKRSVRDAVFNQDGTMIASGSWDKTLQIWESRTGKIIEKQILDGKLWSIAFSPDDRYVAVASENNPIKVWDRDSKKWRKSIKGHNGRVNKILFIVDGLISAGDDQTCQWWDMVSGDKRSFSIPQYWKNSARIPDWKLIALSPDGEQVALAATGFVSIWNLKEKQPFPLELPISILKINDIEYSPNGRFLAVASREGMIQVWDLTLRNKSTTYEGKQMDFRELAFSSDGLYLAAIGIKKIKTIGDKSLISSALILKLDGDNFQKTKYIQLGDSEAKDLSLGPEGNLLAVIGNKTIQVHYVDNKRKMLRHTIEDATFRKVAFSPDGQYLVVSVAPEEPLKSDWGEIRVFPIYRFDPTQFDDNITLGFASLSGLQYNIATQARKGNVAGALGSLRALIEQSPDSSGKYTGWLKTLEKGDSPFDKKEVLLDIVENYPHPLVTSSDKG
jgi:WD40 repeat protein